jgi:subtilisin family serine protease
MVHDSKIAAVRFGRDACTLTNYDDELEVLTTDFTRADPRQGGQGSSYGKDGTTSLAEQAGSVIDTLVADRERTTKLEQAAAKLKQEVTDATKLYELPAVWAVTRGENVKVAVLDNGVAHDHPALRGAVIAREKFVDDLGLDPMDPEVRRYSSHGTHCAGIIAAREFKADAKWKKLASNVPFSGIAPAASILVVRCRRKIRSGQEPSAVAVPLPEPRRGHQLSASHH